MPHDGVSIDIAREAQAVKRRAAYAGLFRTPLSADVLADLFKTCGLFARNDAVDHANFNPMAAGSIEGSRRVALQLIENTIGLDRAIALLAAEIQTAHAQMPPRAAARQAMTENAEAER